MKRSNSTHLIHKERFYPSHHIPPQTPGSLLKVKGKQKVTECPFRWPGDQVSEPGVHSAGTFSFTFHWQVGVSCPVERPTGRKWERPGSKLLDLRCRIQRGTRLCQEPQESAWRWRPPGWHLDCRLERGQETQLCCTQTPDHRNCETINGGV